MVDKLCLIVLSLLTLLAASVIFDIDIYYCKHLPFMCDYSKNPDCIPLWPVMLILVAIVSYALFRICKDLCEDSQPQPLPVNIQLPEIMNRNDTPRYPGSYGEQRYPSP